MRGSTLLLFGLALLACSVAARLGIAADPAMTADAPALHRLQEQGALTQPLLPQPGDIWAGVLPAMPHGVPASLPVSHRDLPDPGVAAVPRPIASPRGRQAAAGPAAAAPVQASARAMVQLAAAGSMAQAEAAWHRLQQRAPALTRGHHPSIDAAEVDGRRVWRLRTGGFADITEARAFCGSLRLAQAACWVVPAASR